MRIPLKLVEPYQQVYRETYEKIFWPTPSEPLEWREVRALFREVGQVAWQPNGDLKVTRNGHVLSLRPPTSKEVSGPDEFLELQRFLERSDEAAEVAEVQKRPTPAVLPLSSPLPSHAR